MNNKEWKLIIRGFGVAGNNEIHYGYGIYNYGNKYKVVTGYDQNETKYPVDFENDLTLSWKEDETVFVTEKTFDSFIELYEAIMENEYQVAVLNGEPINLRSLLNFQQIAKLSNPSAV